jgi:mannose-6-phosphate isomerase-like protein (cupin superfamily)
MRFALCAMRYVVNSLLLKYMTREEWEKQLQSEGVTDIKLRDEKPDFFLADHTHDVTVAHVILSGEMTLTVEGKPSVLKEGDRMDIPAHAVHSAKMGESGCVFLTGNVKN